MTGKQETSLPAADVPAADAPERVVIITGLSGAGKTTALKVFEDLGYEAVDNPPLQLLRGLIGHGSGSPESAGSPADSGSGCAEGCRESRPRPLAIGVDIRSRDFDVHRLLMLLHSLRQEQRLRIEVLFLDADDETLVNRYTETRRRHPIGGDLPVPDGVAMERTMLADLRGRADLVIDTTRLPVAQFRDMMARRFATDTSPPMTVFVVSFGFRNGLPRSADLVFDVRFLRNPHYDPLLRPLTGREQAVVDYIHADQGFTTFFERLTSLLDPLMSRYEEEGKKYLTIAIGCTGGKHRSVAVAEQLAQWLASTGQHVIVRHRDCPPDGTAEALSEGDPPPGHPARGTATGETLPGKTMSASGQTKGILE